VSLDDVDHVSCCFPNFLYFKYPFYQKMGVEKHRVATIAALFRRTPGTSPPSGAAPRSARSRA
jgi:hypothetical protein